MKLVNRYTVLIFGFIAFVILAALFEVALTR